MRLKQLLLAILLIGFSSSTTAFSNDVVAHYFSILKSVPAKYTIEGMVCEKVAVLETEGRWNKRDYTVYNGIIYKIGSRTIGELDLVVVRNSDKEAVMVGEVKCRRNLGAAASKARSQLKRFRDFIASHRGDYDMYLVDSPRISFQINQFDEDPRYISVSQLGGVQAGFDQEISLTLNQSTTLRHQLVRCQMSGRCPRP